MVSCLISSLRSAAALSYRDVLHGAAVPGNDLKVAGCRVQVFPEKLEDAFVGLSLARWRSSANLERTIVELANAFALRAAVHFNP